MIKRGELDDELGYHYCKDDTNMVEYHVDDNITFQHKYEDFLFGGYLTLQKPVDKKSMTINSQDKAINKQLLLSGSYWTLSDRSRQLCPKDKGQDLMISPLCLQELGKTMTEVNKKGEKYGGKSVSTIVCSSPNKLPLIITSFKKTLEYIWTKLQWILEVQENSCTS